MKTINDVFRLSGNELTRRHLREAQKHPDMAETEKAALKVGKAKMWQRYLAQEMERLPELLDVDMAKIIAGAWNKHQDLRKYGDQSRYKPTETVKVALIDHKVRSSHQPHIDFLLNGTKTGQLKFDVKLTLAIKGLELKIKGGRIKTLRIGSCEGSGEILLHKMRIAKEKTRKLEFSDEISLGEGIPIGSYRT